MTAPEYSCYYEQICQSLHSRPTSFDKLQALFFGHVLLEVSVDKAIDVSAAGATNGT